MAQIESAWIELHHHPNSDFDFYRTVLRSSSNVVSPLILALNHGSSPDAILVGRMEESHLDLRLGYARLPQPRVRAMVFIYGGLLGTPSAMDCQAFGHAITGALRHGDADVAIFNHLRADSPLYPVLLRQPGVLVRDHFPSISIHRQLVLPASVDEFWAHLSPKVRGNLRWQMKKFLKVHSQSARIECFSQPSDVNEMIGQMEYVARRTYQRGLGVGFADQASERERLQFKADRGWLRAYLLYLGGTPCAFWCGTLYRGVLHSDYLGYDPAFREFSPGIYLIVRTIEEFCKLGPDREVQAIDFGLGDAKYKADLANSQWLDASLCMFAPSLRGIALNACRTPVLLADKVAHRIAGDSAQGKIKGFWRRLSARKSAKAEAQNKTEPQ